jgi:maltooligosyltrehalose trehalohydrolase
MTRFSVWAPEAREVAVEVGGSTVPMRPGPRVGWWHADVPAAGHGTDYAFRVDGSDPLPDPRSAWQPHGVHGPSRVLEHDRFAWTDRSWRGRQLRGSVVYELHVGTFSPEGTFEGAVARLDHLVDLGVDLVEVMPVAAFPGEHGWGYDGVDLWAVHEPYGGPEGFKRFVDACHARGLGVVLDVVYNHLGPTGNYLGRFGPYFTEAHQTPWGAAVNLAAAGSDEVRRFVVDNALSWLRDYHVDGLRLDAVHALSDQRAVHILEELSMEVEALAAAEGRPLFLIAESDLNDPRVVTSREAGGLGVHAQWNDDFHHALHSLLTGERQGYYADFGSPAALAKTLTGAYFHDGTWSSFRGRGHGRPVDVTRLPGHRFVGYLQDHDQVGNRALGDRICASLSPRLAAVGAALVLTSPFTPMLFMGEEWGASTPWQFFTDHPEPELADSVRQGRRAEFAEHGWAAHDVPDPQDAKTFQRSKLDWAERDREPHRGLQDWYRRLVTLRRAEPDLADPWLHRIRVEYDEERRWLVVHRGGLRIVANLARTPQAVPVAGAGEVLLASDPEGVGVDPEAVRMAAESVAVVRAG